VCDDCGCSLTIERDTKDGVPDEQGWHQFPDCPVCDGFLGSTYNADEQTARESALRQGDHQMREIRRLYTRQRDVLDAIAQKLTDWHGLISTENFLDCFDGGNEDLIPDAFDEVTP
jgi:hypothetical protein